MRKVMESRFGKRESAELPAASYIAEKLAEMEDNEPTAAKLDEIISADDPEDLGVTWHGVTLHGSYIGPLPKSCGCAVKHVGLIGRKKGGGFNTEGSASYPPPMCKWIADIIIDARLCIQTRQASS